MKSLPQLITESEDVTPSLKAAYARTIALEETLQALKAEDASDNTRIAFLESEVARLKAQLPPPPPPVPGMLVYDFPFTKHPAEYKFAIQAAAPDRVTIGTFAGRAGVRLLTKRGDNNISGSGNLERCDLMQAIDPARGMGAPVVFREGDRQKWKTSLLFPSDFQFPTWQNYALFSWHHEFGGGANTCVVGFLRDPASDANKGRLCFSGAAGGSWASATHRYGGAISGLAVQAPQVDRWYDFVIDVLWSSDPTKGFFHGWVNGERRISHSGPTLPNNSGVYLKLSNYHLPICDPYPACIGNHKDSSVIHGHTAMATTFEQLGWKPSDATLNRLVRI